ncbi:dihydroneopterin aldolase [Ginsengibacter hankyongi]|uniref:dihydroneopterin aldolase n=1 Tax=Ginsengibacter hankyongi TaxID=2607284 RepID=A0A5J5IAZ1_9BACT|nr:dihydroneopterin aldolase [Ginsengibacter hankyongi]KAA9034648.1 dihydroneopterin aldolase [Ginsengibacter hankyongi]
MVTVHLHDLRFNAFHGVHEEERLLGNEYIIDASVEFHEDLQVINSINDTINYADIYNIIRERMNVPTPLLENVVMEIGNEIHNEFPQVRSINISIKKLHPPIEGIRGSAGVNWQKQF